MLLLLLLGIEEDTCLDSSRLSIAQNAEDAEDEEEEEVVVQQESPNEPRADVVERK